MKTFFTLLFCLVVGFSFAQQKLIKDDCTCVSLRFEKTIPLYGNVKVVQGAANFKVRIVNINPDLKVEISKRTPYLCGEWQFDENFRPDFTIEYVQVGEDFTIQFVEAFPGLYPPR